MRQMMAMLLLVLVVANLIVKLPLVVSLVSQAIFADHLHNTPAPEAVNLNLDTPNIAGEVILLEATDTISPLCPKDMPAAPELPSSQNPGIHIGDNDAITLDNGLMIPDDPPRYKLDLPNYDQFRVVLWARDSAPQTLNPDAPSYICTKSVPTHKVKPGSC